MMKKKNLKVYLLSFIFLATLSCGDEFTNTSPFGVLSEDQLANVTGVELQLAGAYAIVSGVRSTGSANNFGISPDNWWFDVISDDAHKGSNNSDQADLESLETLEIFPNNSFVQGRFQALFAGVSRANAVIAAIRVAPEDEDLSFQEAQARFLRGYFYFELTKIFGNVPILTEVEFAAAIDNLPNSGPAWDLIESDFQFAIENLTAERVSGQEAIPTAGAARAFLGKAHIYQQEWSEGLAQLSAVINSGEFALQPEFLNNFTLVGENGIEAVFQAQFSAEGANSLSGNQGGTLNFPGGDPFGSCCGFYQPTIDLANAYLVDETTGLPNNLDGSTILENDFDTASDAPFTLSTAAVDPRLDYTVGRRGIDYNGFGENPGAAWIRAVPSNGDFSGPYMPKKNVYQNSEIASARGRGVWGQEHSGLNYNIMRYADVLLLAAEAAVETGDLNTALNLVNQVRERAANSTPVQAVDGSGPAANYQIGTYTAFADADSARQAVRMERRLELGMEGQRFFDLARWGVAPQVINNYIDNEARVINPQVGTNFVTQFQDFQTIMPIPTTSINISQGVLLQNPGY